MKKHFTHDNWHPICRPKKIYVQRTMTEDANSVTCKLCIKMIDKGMRDLS